LRLAGVQALRFAVLELLHLGLVFLDEFFVLLPLFDARVRIFSLALADHTSRCQHIAIDIARNVFFGVVYLLQLGLHKFFLGCLLASVFLFSAARLLLVLLLHLLELRLVNLLLLVRLLDKLLQALSKLGRCSVTVGRLQILILGLGSCALHDTLDRREVIIKRLQLVLHLSETLIAKSSLLLSGHADASERFHLLALKSVLKFGHFTLLSDATHEYFFGRVVHLALQLLNETRLAQPLALVLSLHALLAVLRVLKGHRVELGSLVDTALVHYAAALLARIVIVIAIADRLIACAATFAHVVLNVGLALLFVVVHVLLAALLIILVIFLARHVQILQIRLVRQVALSHCLCHIGHLVDLVLQLLVERLEFLEERLNVGELVNDRVILHGLPLHLEEQVEGQERAVTHQQVVLHLQIRHPTRRRFHFAGAGGRQERQQFVISLHSRVLELLQQAIQLWRVALDDLAHQIWVHNVQLGSLFGLLVGVII